MAQRNSISVDCKSLFLSVASMLILVLAISLLFEPRWRTNDDVLMAMISHGYGLVFESSPNLVFSNVLWGHFIQTLPNSDWLPGYSLASFLCLIICGSVLIQGLKINDYSNVSIFFVILFFMLAPVVRPQFTINAGLLMVASISSLLLFNKEKREFYFYLSMFLAFAAFLVRKEEMLLVLLVAIPMLPIKNLISHKKVAVSTIITAFAIVGAYHLDKQSYKGADWKQHQSFESVRNYFTDIKVHSNYVITEQNLRAHHLSNNDVSLLQNWFFVDTDISNVQNLQSFTSQIKEKKSNQEMSNVMKSLKSYFDIKVIGLTLFILMLIAKTLSRKLLVSLLISIAAFAFIGWMGRPSIIRIYIPVLTLLGILPLIAHSDLKSFINRPIVQLCLIGFIFLNFLAYHHSATVNQQINKVRKSFVDYQGEPFYIWGGRFPYELLYPVFNQDHKLKEIKLLGMNTASFSPYSNTSRALTERASFKNLITEKNGVVMYGLQNDSSNMLKQYCKEHINGSTLNIEPYFDNHYFQINKYKCTR